MQIWSCLTILQRSEIVALSSTYQLFQTIKWLQSTSDVSIRRCRLTSSSLPSSCCLCWPRNRPEERRHIPPSLITSGRPGSPPPDCRSDDIRCWAGRPTSTVRRLRRLKGPVRSRAPRSALRTRNTSSIATSAVKYPTWRSSTTAVAKGTWKLFDSVRFYCCSVCRSRNYSYLLSLE